MQINQHKLTTNRFTVEVDGELDRDKYICITTEAQIYDVSTPDNNDGTFDRIYKCKAIGRTIVKQGDDKLLLAKSKHSRSQALRRTIQRDNPDEEYYEKCMNALISNWDDVSDYLIKEGKLYV